jgi:D-alanine-D-alanine ligase-like ATP-grasp enzyme
VGVGTQRNFHPPFMHFGPNEDDYQRALESFGLPVFVKPTCLGSSIGVSRVKSASALHAAVELARSHGSTISIEKEIRGGEYFAGILEEMTLPLIRVSPSRIYDYTAKYESDETRYHCQPRPLSWKNTRNSVALQLLGVGWGQTCWMSRANPGSLNSIPRRG